MADKRIYSLGDVPENLTGYYLALDKSGIANALKLSHTALIAQAVAAVAAVPVVSTPTITEVIDGDTVTVIAIKKIVTGKIVVIQANITVNLTNDKTSLLLQFSENSLGTTSQVLSCCVDSDTDAEVGFCQVDDDNPFRLYISWPSGAKNGITQFQINGTLITT